MQEKEQRRMRRLKPNEKAEVARLYQMGAPPKAIAQLYDIAANTVWRIVKDNDVPLQTPLRSVTHENCERLSTVRKLRKQVSLLEKQIKSIKNHKKRTTITDVIRGFRIKKKGAKCMLMFKIYDYDSNSVDVELPIDSILEIESVNVKVVTGDEVISVKLKKGELLGFDSCEGGRLMDFVDYEYDLTNADEIGRWINFNPDFEKVSGAGYQRADEFC